MIKSDNRWLEIIAGLANTPPFHVALEDQGDITVGSIVVFNANATHVPDAALVLHLSVEGGETAQYNMAMDGQSGSYSWQSYYSEPTMDVDDVTHAYVTAIYNGVPYQSNEVVFSGS